MGELIRAQKKVVGLNEGGRPAKTSSDQEGVSKPTLREAGIDHKLSSRAQKLATDIEHAGVADRQDAPVAIPASLDAAHLLPADNGLQDCRCP